MHMRRVLNMFLLNDSLIIWSAVDRAIKSNYLLSLLHQGIISNYSLSLLHTFYFILFFVSKKTTLICAY